MSNIQFVDFPPSLIFEYVLSYATDSIFDIRICTILCHGLLSLEGRAYADEIRFVDDIPDRITVYGEAHRLGSFLCRLGGITC